MSSHLSIVETQLEAAKDSLANLIEADVGPTAFASMMYERDWVLDEIEKCLQPNGAVDIAMLGFVIYRRYFPEGRFVCSKMSDKS